jgi:hypothetical protein
VDDRFKKQISPKEPSALEEWLLIESKEMTDDNWSDRCKDDFSVAISALIHLAERGRWPAQRWRTALQVWSDQSFVLQSWNQLRNVFGAAADNAIEAIAQPLSWWLQALGKVFKEGESQFLELARRVLATQRQEPFEGGVDPIFKAINHPVGQATDAVFGGGTDKAWKMVKASKKSPKVFTQCYVIERSPASDTAE